MALAPKLKSVAKDLPPSSRSRKEAMALAEQAAAGYAVQDRYVDPLVDRAASELVERDDRGLKTDIELEGRPYDVLQSLRQSLGDMALSHGVTHRLIAALEDFALHEGISFSRSAQARPLYARILVTDSAPDDLPDCGRHQYMFLDGIRRQGRNAATRGHIRPTIHGTQSTASSPPGMHEIFEMGKRKGLLVFFATRERDDAHKFETLDDSLLKLMQAGHEDVLPVADIRRQLQQETIAPEVMKLVETVAACKDFLTEIQTPGAVPDEAAQAQILAREIDSIKIDSIKEAIESLALPVPDFLEGLRQEISLAAETQAPAPDMGREINVEKNANVMSIAGPEDNQPVLLPESVTNENAAHDIPPEAGADAPLEAVTVQGPDSDRMKPSLDAPEMMADVAAPAIPQETSAVIGEQAIGGPEDRALATDASRAQDKTALNGASVHEAEATTAILPAEEASLPPSSDRAIVTEIKEMAVPEITPVQNEASLSTSSAHKIETPLAPQPAENAAPVPPSGSASKHRTVIQAQEAAVPEAVLAQETAPLSLPPSAISVDVAAMPPPVLDIPAVAVAVTPAVAPVAISSAPLMHFTQAAQPVLPAQPLPASANVIHMADYKARLTVMPSAPAPLQKLGNSFNSAAPPQNAKAEPVKLARPLVAPDQALKDHPPGCGCAHCKGAAGAAATLTNNSEALFDLSPLPPAYEPMKTAPAALKAPDAAINGHPPGCGCKLCRNSSGVEAEMAKDVDNLFGPPSAYEPLATVVAVPLSPEAGINGHPPGCGCAFCRHGGGVAASVTNDAESLFEETPSAPEKRRPAPPVLQVA